MIFNFKNRNFLKGNPVRMVCFSFIAIILIGAFLLFLPISYNANHSTSFMDCLFTSTSATCVTGFSAKDTFTHWSLFGKLVILILIQVGGLGLITFSTIFLIFFNNKLSLKNLKLASSQINVNNLADVKTIFKTILLITLSCELIGALLLSFSYCKKFGVYGYFMAVFSSIAAYCNAGLDLNGVFYKNCSFVPFQKDYLVMFTISALTFIGGIGFVTINEIINLKARKIKLKFLSVHSKIVLFGSFFLLIIGTLGFLVLEFNETLKELSFLEKISNSIFNSTAARTSGFVSVDFSKISSLTKMFLSILMFIGANPTGTSGGIKINTIIILISTIFCVVKNEEETVIFGHRVKKTIVYKAMALFFLSLFIIFIAILIIWNFNFEIGLNNIVFSVVSAFSTTGFQVINSKFFSYFSKAVLIFLMYVGRVGPISFALMFKVNKKNKRQILMPDSNLFIWFKIKNKEKLLT